MRIIRKNLAERLFVVVDKHNSILSITDTELSADDIKSILGLSTEASLFDQIYGSFGWAIYTVDEDGYEDIFWEHNTNLTNYYLHGKYRN